MSWLGCWGWILVRDMRPMNTFSKPPSWFSLVFGRRRPFFWYMNRFVSGCKRRNWKETKKTRTQAVKKQREFEMKIKYQVFHIFWPVRTHPENSFSNFLLHSLWLFMRSFNFRKQLSFPQTTSSSVRGLSYKESLIISRTFNPKQHSHVVHSRRRWGEWMPGSQSRRPGIPSHKPAVHRNGVRSASYDWSATREDHYDHSASGRMLMWGFTSSVSRSVLFPHQDYMRTLQAGIDGAERWASPYSYQSTVCQCPNCQPFKCFAYFFYQVNSTLGSNRSITRLFTTR